MPNINFSDIQKLTSDDAVKQWLKETLGQFSNDDPPLISDCLVNYHTGAAPFLEYMASVDEENMVRGMPSFRWKIKVLCDEWGNEPKPGDVVRRQHKRPLHYKIGQPIPGSELSAMKRDGRYEEQLVYYSEFEVDEKGCINCGFHDTVHFLSLWGVHPKGKPITNKKATSGDVHPSPDGGMKHIRYHRYKEIDKAAYNRLPTIKKRGRQKNEEDIHNS